MSGNVDENGVHLDSEIKITNPQKKLIGYTGIRFDRNYMSCPDYPSMFSALRELTDLSDGLLRFVRCIYTLNSKKYLDIFRLASGDTDSFDALCNYLFSHGYDYTVTYDTSEIHNFESSSVTFFTRIAEDESLPGHRKIIGVSMNFEMYRYSPFTYKLHLNRVRDMLKEFDSLDEQLKKLIERCHPVCDNCGYCSLRSGQRQKVYALPVNIDGNTNMLCPINYVYHYRWSTLDNDKIQDIIHYLDYAHNRFEYINNVTDEIKE